MTKRLQKDHGGKESGTKQGLNVHNSEEINLEMATTWYLYVVIIYKMERFIQKYIFLKSRFLAVVPLNLQVFTII